MNSKSVIFDEFPGAVGFKPHLSELKIKRIDSIGPRLDAAYQLLASAFNTAVLDSKETYIELLSPNGLQLDGFPLICIAACFDVDDQEVMAGALSANLMWIDPARKVLQLAIGNIATSPQLIKKPFRGVGKALLNAAIYLAQGIAAAHSAELAYVVAEAESESLGFWRKSAFLWPEGLEYLQPPLEFDTTGKPVRAEMSETFQVRPIGHRSQHTIETDLLQSMIRAIYRNWSIESNSRKLSPDALQNAEAYVMGQVYPQVAKSITGAATRELAVLSDHEPSCAFSQCAVVFHFVCVPKHLERGQDMAPSFNCTPDETLDSIERDLLACNHREGCLFRDGRPYRDGRPFRSRVRILKESSKNVVIKFPDTMTYHAEGKSFSYRNRRHRNCRVAVFRTDFQNHIEILSLALTPVEDEVFDEIDVIGLAKLWEGGEGVGIDDKNCSHCKIRFEYSGPPPAVAKLSTSAEISHRFGKWLGRFVHPKLARRFEPKPRVELDPERHCVPKNEKGLTISELVQTFFPLSHSARMRLAGGTIQIVRPHGLDSNGNVLLLDLDGVFRPRKAQSKKDIHRWQMAFKGMETGLLDIGDLRVDDQELKDSLSRFKEMFDEEDSKEYVVANKATLLVINTNCRLYEQLNTKVGANPYLWLPHLLAIYNEEVLRIALKAFQNAEGSETEFEYETALTIMRGRLQSDSLPNVFHYDHEQQLYLKCGRTRGLNQLRKTAIARLTRVKGRVEESRRIRERRFASAIQVLGLLIVVFTIIGSYEQIRSFPERAFGTFIGLGIGTLVIAIGVMLIGQLPGSKLFRNTPHSRGRWFESILYVTVMIFIVYSSLEFLSKFGKHLADNSAQPPNPAATQPIVPPNETPKAPSK